MICMVCMDEGARLGRVPMVLKGGGYVRVGEWEGEG